jgi:hypothetical protein
LSFVDHFLQKLINPKPVIIVSLTGIKLIFYFLLLFLRERLHLSLRDLHLRRRLPPALAASSSVAGFIPNLNTVASIMDCNSSGPTDVASRLQLRVLGSQ